MITSSFGLTATKRVLPKLTLDFTTASLDNRVTFTRTTGASNPATYVNSSGVITAATNNQPRFDYDPVTLVCKGLLIEEARTNACTYSSSLASWTGGVATVNSDTVLAPDGTTTADELVRVSSQDDSKYNVLSFTGDGTKSVSIFLKYVSSSSVRILLYETTTAATRADFRISFSAGVPSVTSSPAGIVEGIDNFGNGWYRLRFVATGVIAANTNRLYVYPAYAGAANSEKTACWGAQAEDGAFATSYIPTTTTVLTRNASVATITGTNFSNFWRSTQGGVIARALPSIVSGTRPIIQFDDNTADNVIALRGNTTNPELYIKATTDQAQIDAGTIAANAAYTLGATWASDNCAANLNGGAPVLDTSATIPTVTQARLGSDGTDYLNGHIQSIEYYDQRIMNSELQILAGTAGSASIFSSILNSNIIQ